MIPGLSLYPQYRGGAHDRSNGVQGVHGLDETKRYCEAVLKCGYIQTPI